MSDKVLEYFENSDEDYLTILVNDLNKNGFDVRLGEATSKGRSFFFHLNFLTKEGSILNDVSQNQDLYFYLPTVDYQKISVFNDTYQNLNAVVLSDGNTVRSEELELNLGRIFSSKALINLNKAMQSVKISARYVNRSNCLSNLYWNLTGSLRSLYVPIYCYDALPHFSVRYTSKSFSFVLKFTPEELANSTASLWIRLINRRDIPTKQLVDILKELENEILRKFPEYLKRLNKLLEANPLKAVYNQKVFDFAYDLLMEHCEEELLHNDIIAAFSKLNKLIIERKITECPVFLPIFVEQFCKEYLDFTPDEQMLNKLVDELDKK